MPADNSQEWDGPERRSMSHDRVTRMIESALEQRSQVILEHIDGKFEQMQELFRSAFPGGDPDGHRRAHESAIKGAEKWDKFKMGLYEKLAYGVVSGGMIFLGMAAWEYLKTQLGSR